MKITIYLPVLLTQKELAIRYGNGVGLALLQTQIDSLSTKDLIKLEPFPLSFFIYKIKQIISFYYSYISSINKFNLSLLYQLI